MRLMSAVPVWMGWNTFLALIPLGLSFVIFGQRSPRLRGVPWWIGFTAFLVTLPNAPYVLTDVIHLIDDAQDGVLIRTVLLYGAFIGVGVLAYTVCIARFVAHLRRAGAPAAALVSVEIALHAVVAVGVLIGRYGRWNSWDLGTRPLAVIHDSAGWMSPRAIVGVGLLATGLIAITVMLRLAARGAVGLVNLGTWA